MKGVVGSLGGAERMLSGLGVRPDMVHPLPGQNMQGFDFTDESGTFHTFSPEKQVRKSSTLSYLLVYLSLFYFRLKKEVVWGQ